MKLTSKELSLSAKLILVGTPFLLMALCAIAATLWVSWHLDGGVAAVNEAGRMRMQTYRMALTASTNDNNSVPELITRFNQSLQLLRTGDPERPLFLPLEESVQSNMDKVERNWRVYQLQLVQNRTTDLNELRTQTIHFVSNVDALVGSIESYMARWTAILHLLQMAVLAFVLLGATVILVTGYVLVYEPVTQLKAAIQKIQQGDFNARVEHISNDEFGALGQGFNAMAERLQDMYRNLEHKVQEKTVELEDKRERLEALYDVTAMVANATSLDALAKCFSEKIVHIAHADGVAVRWSDHTHQRSIMLAASGLPADLVEDENCLEAGSCYCGAPVTISDARIIPIHALHEHPKTHCVQAGFNTVINVPIRLHENQMGEVSLFYHAIKSLSSSERSLLEVLASHLASGMENIRLQGLERESAIFGERNLLARELHDSIAQSLAFLKIQVQLLRDTLKHGTPEEVQSVLSEIDLGVRESYGDVRELLVHFRTRTNEEDIEPAIATTLRKFEQQTGLKTQLNMQGHGLPLSPDIQIQVLHIVQEALSNVRKHSRASMVWLDVQQQPNWQFEIRDNGIGFESSQSFDETHVGLRIMQERANKINATLEIISKQTAGTSVLLSLPYTKQVANNPTPIHTNSVHLLSPDII